MPSHEQYQRLGVTSESTALEVRRAYRRQVLTCHPDKFDNDARKEAEFRILKEAYEEVRARAEGLEATHQTDSHSAAAYSSSEVAGDPAQASRSTASRF